VKCLKTRKGSREKLLDVLDESFQSIFGENTAKAVYYHLREGHLLRFEDIPEKPQSFAKALEKIFGEAGAEVIETLLVKDIRAKFGIEVRGKRETDRLADCLEEIRHQESALKKS
jgi:hypothetical protein